MKTILLILLACVTCANAVTTTLTNQHIDLSVNYNATLDDWMLTVRDESTDYDPGIDIRRREFATDQVLLLGTTNSRLLIPANPNFAFLGAAGDPVWILPQSQNAQVLFAGLSGENKSASGWEGIGVSSDFLVKGVTSGTFLGNQVLCTLESYSGPGNFFLYSNNQFGAPTIHMRTDNGLSSADAKTVGAGSHAHFNWAFTQPGTYAVGLRASGTLAANSVFSASELTTFTFFIVPEPGVLGLLAAGGLLFFRRNKRKTNNSITKHD